MKRFLWQFLNSQFCKVCDGENSWNKTCVVKDLFNFGTKLSFINFIFDRSNKPVRRLQILASNDVSEIGRKSVLLV